MREGKAKIQYKHLYAYERGKDSKPEIIPEQAEAVRDIYERFLACHSIRMIKDELKVLSGDRIRACFRGGIKIEQMLIKYG